MSTHDDFNVNISQNEDSELSEKEYSDILGLEGMAGGGEAALEEEIEEEKEEDSLVHVLAEQHNSKSKSAYRRYTHEDEAEERQEAEITIPEQRESGRKREDLSTNVSLDDHEQLDREVYIASIPIESTQSNTSHTDFRETVVVKPFDTTINNVEQLNHFESEVLENPIIEQDIIGYEPSIPLDQMENWKNSPISEREAFSDEKFDTAEYWIYLQTNVSEYARSVQMENSAY